MASCFPVIAGEETVERPVITGTDASMDVCGRGGWPHAAPQKGCKAQDDPRGLCDPPPSQGQGKETLVGIEKNLGEETRYS